MGHLATSEVLAAIPRELRDPLLETFDTIVRNYRENRWEPSELNGGKFCEVVYSIIKGHIDSSFPQKPSKPHKPGTRIEIEPMESEFGKILQRPGD